MRTIVWHFNMQLIKVVNEVELSLDQLVKKNLNFKRYTTYIHISKRNSQTKCEFHLRFADSAYNMWFPPTDAEFASAQFN